MGLRAFAIIYTMITLFLFGGIYSEQSASLGYVFMLVGFWIIGIIVLGGLIYWKKIKVKSKWDWLILIFATPIPAFLLMFIGLPKREIPASSYEYNMGRHRHRVMRYDYKSGKIKRMEFFKSVDSVTDDKPFPANDTWLKDSIWIYYDNNGQIERTEDYRNSERNGL